MFTLALGVVALAVFDRLCEHDPSMFPIHTADLRSRLVVRYRLRLARYSDDCPFLYVASSDHRTVDLPEQYLFPSQAIIQILFTLPLMMHYGMAGVILASMVIFLYDGTRGNIKGAVAKYSFYAFYPLHLWTIGIMVF